MPSKIVLYVFVCALLIAVLHKAWQRLLLSRAKHPSLHGHARLSRFLACFVPYYAYDEEKFFNCDAAGAEIASRRRKAFESLSAELASRAPLTLSMSAELEASVSDMQFTNANRVPFQFRSLVARSMRPAGIAHATDGVRIQDLDGNWSYDLSGSYGVNLLGFDFYKRCINRGVHRAEKLGPVLGQYHPVIGENVSIIKDISGLDEVSFHMSGTEAVMQAVRLARFHTRRKQLVLFCGAYHGWWDGVQAGIGHRRSLRDAHDGLIQRDEKAVYDLLPDLKTSKGWVTDKPEGVAVTRDGRVFVVTDNDSVEDWSGETWFLRLDRVGRLFRHRKTWY